MLQKYIRANIAPGKSLKSPGKPSNLVFFVRESPGQQCRNVCTTPVGFFGESVANSPSMFWIEGRFCCEYSVCYV